MKTEWGSDNWGRLDELGGEGPSIEFLDLMAGLPGFRKARAGLVRALGLRPGMQVLEAGCGPGTSLPLLARAVERRGAVVGTDLTRAFVAEARRRCRVAGLANVTCRVGDIRRLPFRAGAFDAALCDKVLMHAGPTEVAIAELMRVTRPGGGVGAIEWDVPATCLNSRDPATTEALIANNRRNQYNGTVSRRLGEYFHGAGLTRVKVVPGFVHATALRGTQFWRAYLARIAMRGLEAGVFDEGGKARWLDELESLDRAGGFYVLVPVNYAVGTKA